MYNKIAITFLSFAVAFTSAIYADAAPKRQAAMDVRTSFSDTVKKVSPAVVNIFSQKVVSTSQSPFMNDPFFSQFLGQGLTGHMRKRVERSLGSGVVVTKDGHILTNFHVIQGAKRVKVVFGDSREYNARFIAADSNTDIAVLKIEADEMFDYVEFGDSDTLEVGDVVLALGNPYGVGQSVSMGIISALGRSNLGSGKYENFIQTDAAINPGNSGGALVDSLGKLIGVNTAIFSKSGGSQGIGFSVPANSIKAMLASVLSTGKITRPWLGAEGQNITPDLAAQLELKRAVGILINQIAPESPAEASGLRIGDIVTHFDDYPVETTGHLGSRISGSYMGRDYPLKVLREGKEQMLTLNLRGVPERDPNAQVKLMGIHPLSGYSVEQLSIGLNVELNLAYRTKGVAIVALPQKKRGGFLSSSFSVGDVITQVNGKDIKTMKDLRAVLSRRPGTWNFTLKRGNSVKQVVIR